MKKLFIVLMLLCSAVHSSESKDVIDDRPVMPPQESLFKRVSCNLSQNKDWLFPAAKAATGLACMGFLVSKMDLFLGRTALIGASLIWSVQTMEYLDKKKELDKKVIDFNSEFLECKDVGKYIDSASDFYLRGLNVRNSSREILKKPLTEEEKDEIERIFNSPQLNVEILEEDQSRKLLIYCREVLIGLPKKWDSKTFFRIKNGLNDLSSCLRNKLSVNNDILYRQARDLSFWISMDIQKTGNNLKPTVLNRDELELNLNVRAGNVLSTGVVALHSYFMIKSLAMK